jgi:hypothetical protein
MELESRESFGRGLREVEGCIDGRIDTAFYVSAARKTENARLMLEWAIDGVVQVEVEADAQSRSELRLSLQVDTARRSPQTQGCKVQYT